MDLDTLKEQVRTALKDSDLNKTFALLNKYIDKESDVCNELTLLEAKKARTRKSGRMGTVDYQNIELATNQLIKSTSEFVNDLKPHHLSENPQSNENGITAKILAYAPGEDREKDLQDYFKELNFTNVDVVQYEKEMPLNDYVLIVFDNRDLPFKPDEEELKTRTDFMERCLRENQYAVHFGNFLPWINHNRDYVHAANSRFALFARIKEMLEYITSKT